MKKSFHKMLLDVVEKLLCFMFINYRDISPSWEGGKIQFAAPQDKKFILGCCGFRLVCGFNVCIPFFFLQREKTGREEDLRFNLRARWKANTDVRSEK